MAVFYQDASAIAKLYLRNEIGVDFVLELLGSPSPDDRFFTSALSIVEVKSAISRRIDRPNARSVLIAAYDGDVYEMFEVLPMDHSIIVEAGTVVENHRLRAGDAIHLATALSIAATTIQPVFMVSSDVELLEAAEAAGLGALDPQMDDAIDRLHYIREQQA